MVNPARFGWNAGTAASNAMQQASAARDAARVSAAGRAEGAALARALANEGVNVILVDQDPASTAPDAVFPNNWLSFHADGTLCLYPMLAESRRQERDEAVIDAACARSGFRIRRRLDLSAHEREGRFLEGTGSLVLDHVARVAYAALSPRTDAGLVAEWCRLMDYQPCLFDATDEQGKPYYHTNVMLWIGTRIAAVCSEAIAPAQRAAVRSALTAGGRELLEISRAQVAAFAGNMLELATWDEALGDSSLLVMSARARATLAPQEFGRIAAAVDNLLVAPVPTIEEVGGGSVRCMLAEIPAVSAG